MGLRCWLRDQLASHLYYVLSVCSILIQRLTSRPEADTVKCPPITRLSLLAARSLPFAGKFSVRVLARIRNPSWRQANASQR